MLKTVWMADYVLKSLQTNQNIIYTTHKVLFDELSIREDTLVLLEPDGTVGHVIHCLNQSAWLGRAEDLPFDKELIQKVSDSEEILTLSCGLLAPLRMSNTAVFALLFLKDAKPVTAEKQAELIRALSAYSAILYNNAMSGFILSYHPTVMQVKDLRVTYGSSDHEVVHGVSFDLCANEFAVLLGSSGCGKTTTVNVLGGMLKSSGGSVLWNGKDVTKFTDRECTAFRRESVGFIFQHYNLINDLTAGENVGVATSLVKNPMPVEEALALVGLKEKIDKYPYEMSGGEQQRVCIARAIAKRASLLICDEPTGALDPENAAAIIRILQDIVKTQGIPVIMITHNPALSVVADHYILMSAGQILEDLRQPFPLNAANLILQ